MKLMEALQQLDSLLEERKSISDEPFMTGDPLVDKWEREIAEGKLPDLEEALDG